MTVALKRIDPTGGLMLPALLLIGLGTIIVGQSNLLTFPSRTVTLAGPQTVTIASRTFTYRATGDYQQDGKPIDGPLLTVTSPPPLEIMKYEVTGADYARCVADGACEAAEPRRKLSNDLPATGINFNDAEDYARWLSAQTGETWRLPTVEEWHFAAGSQATDHALQKATDTANPAERWVALYEKEAALGVGNASALPEIAGSFGENEFGVADLTGTVWEWTSSCDGRTTVDTTGAVISRLDSCGVRLLEGRHQAPMSSFIRDGRSGGCSTGTPPDNLGFRLVKEAPWYAPITRLFGGQPR